MNEAGLHKALQRMKPSELLVFYLKIERGWEVADIVELMGMPQKEIAKMLKDSYQKVRKECVSWQ